MKSKLWILLVLAITIVSCQYEDEYYDEFDQPEDYTEEGDFFDEEEGDTHDQGGGAEGQLTLYQIQGNTISKIRDYEVSGNLSTYQQDYQKHFDMWEFVTRVIPESDRNRMVEFEVFYGGGNLLGYVEPIDPNDLSRWKFALAIDAATQLEEVDFKNMFTYVTIHEFGHVLTLNESQINAGQNSCNNFNPQEGCAMSNSYLNRLFELGWADIYDEFQSLGEDEVDGFYEKYKTRFVSDYAATNPGEDIAEVFSFFITEPNMPNGNSIADQKIKLLYEFDELVELRQEIRQSNNVQGLRAGSWLSNPLRSKFKIVCSHAH